MKSTATSSPAPDPAPEHLVQQIIDRLRQIYRNNLGKTGAGRAALAGYGFEDQALLDRYVVGFSDGNLPKLLPLDKAMRGQLELLGVLDERGQEPFAGCPVFPVETADGRRVNLWACPKEGPARFLRRPMPLWNAIAAKHSAHLYVFTSPTEALSAAMGGCSNIAALDPDVGEPDLKAISGWGVQKISVIVPDTAEGMRRGEQIKSRLGPLKPSLVKIPDCSSINEYYRAKGAQALAEAISAAVLGLPALAIPGMEPRADGFSLTIGGRSYRVRGLLAGPQKLTAIVSRDHAGKMHLDKVDLLSARSRKEFMRELGRIFQEQTDLIEADMDKILKACELRASQTSAEGPSVPKPGTIPEADQKEGEALGRDPRLIELILNDYEQFGLIGERPNKLLSYFAMSSRKLKQPLAILTVAISGSGKSAIQDVTVKFCPPDEVQKVTILSGKSLFHKERESLKHKVIAIEEAEGARQADYPLRVIISAGELTTEVAVKDAATGRLTTVRNKVEGPVAVLLTTTSLSMNPETVSRFFVTTVDESREQTRAIRERQRLEHSLQGLAQEQGWPDILRRHHAFQRLLQGVCVVNPLVDKVEFADDRVSARREFPKRLRLIQAVAFVRQLQKQVKYLGPTPYVEVDETDLKIAQGLMDELFVHHLAELSPMALGLLRQLARMREDFRGQNPTAKSEPFVFTCRKARDYTGTPNSSLQRHLKELCAFEFIIREFGRRGQTCLYRLDWEEPAAGLPTTCPAPSHSEVKQATA